MAEAQHQHFSSPSDETTNTRPYPTITVGIAGAAGYTGGELIRLLIHHPYAQILWLHSNSQAGLPVHSIHHDLVGETELTFTDQPGQETDVVFLCLGHGAARAYLYENPGLLKAKIVDLSQDFRLSDTPFIDSKGQQYSFVYGLTDVDQTVIRKSQYVANPGCFATAIQLGLAPAAALSALDGQSVHINAVTGSTGAGQSLSETSHFSWRSANHSVYKPFGHQHEAEVLQTLAELSYRYQAKTKALPQSDTDLTLQKPQASTTRLMFLPSRGAFARGIFATLYFETDRNLNEWRTIYKAYYADSPFVTVVDTNPNLKQVVNTNKCLVYLEQHGTTILVISMIDNLLKGASGQAVENMNLLFGLPQTTGLRLKAGAF